MTITPEQGIEALGAFFDALEREDMEAVDAVLENTVHPDCEFTSQIGSELDGRTYRGPDGIRTWFADLVATMTLRYEDREFRAIGESGILLLTTFKGKGRVSEVEISREIGVVWELEDGLIRRTVSYPSQADALAAAEALDA